ncbi:MAG: phosphatidylserine decarboxylase family protein [Bacteroidales bacterium]|jgi:phosphatidylserine decarboxylase|nr:phosphatidylserine decarboxylase family protein [Bacteroidales bacterium]
MKIHPEGYLIICIALLLLAGVNISLRWLCPYAWLNICLLVASCLFFGLIIWFFRNPDRPLTPDARMVYAPADGKIVAIEEVEEPEYFHDRRIQVSIFMSPLNVHVNRYPVGGETTFVKYHPGKYLVAWHPKSSLLNERSTIVVRTENGQEVLFRQIAGAVARRIVTYAKEGEQAIQGKDCGFIRFGSRVDVFLPTNAVIKVKAGEKAIGNHTVIAELATTNRE